MRDTDGAFGEVGVTACSSIEECEHVLALIGTIYDAALEPSRWSDVVRGIVEFVGGAKGPLFATSSANRGPSVVFPCRLSESFLQRWRDEYADDDPWLQGAYWSALRALDDAPFTERERERMRVLVPHLSRALGVTFRLRHAEAMVASSRAALDRLASGVLLLDERRHAVFVNRAARRTLDERNGLLLRSTQFAGERYQLLARDAATQARIDAAIRDCLDERALVIRHFSRGVTVQRCSALGPLALQFAPLPRPSQYAAEGHAARVIVFLSDAGAAAAVDARTLARLYRLTPAESRLALAIGRGERLGDAAKRNRTTVATARSQLASVFAKTRTTRQAELVRLLVALGSTDAERM